jgi:acyl-CoA thioesterase
VSLEGYLRRFQALDRLAGTLGIRLEAEGAAGLVARLTLDTRHMNGAACAHGGVVFALADVAFGAAANAGGVLSLGIATQISNYKAVPSGTLHARPRLLAETRRLAHYLVEVTDDAGDLVASFHGTAYRKKESPSPYGEWGLGSREPGPGDRPPPRG